MSALSCCTCVQKISLHLLERTETNIIFIWSGKVILGEAKPTLCATCPSHVSLIQTKRPGRYVIDKSNMEVSHFSGLQPRYMLDEQ